MYFFMSPNVYSHRPDFLWHKHKGKVVTFLLTEHHAMEAYEGVSKNFRTEFIKK
jgi:hypothetical protein